MIIFKKECSCVLPPLHVRKTVSYLWFLKKLSCTSAFQKQERLHCKPFCIIIALDLMKHGVLYPEIGKLWHAQHELAGLFQNDDKRLYWVKTNLEKPYLELLKEEIQDSKNFYINSFIRSVYIYR